MKNKEYLKQKNKTGEKMNKESLLEKKKELESIITYFESFVGQLGTILSDHMEKSKPKSAKERAILMMNGIEHSKTIASISAYSFTCYMLSSFIIKELDKLVSNDGNNKSMGRTT
jgi:hypothetical protein